MRGFFLRDMTTRRQDVAMSCRLGFLSAWLFVVALAGCVSSPPTPRGYLLSKPMSLGEHLKQPLEMEQSVVFTLRGRDFAGIGITRIAPDESFASSCVTAQGMTLFEIAGQGERLDLCHTLPGIGDADKVGAMFAECIRNVYFGNVPAAGWRDSIPPPRAMWYWDKDSRIMTALTSLEDGGNLHHRFSLDDGQLKEKRRYTPRGKLAWSITYDDYDEIDPRRSDCDTICSCRYNTIAPRRIEVRDYTQRYSYTLKLNTINWRVAGEEE